MPFESATDIGTCATFENTRNFTVKRIYCLGNDGLNFCCRLPSVSDLLQESGIRVCCSHEQYSDQQWVVLATIRGFSILLSILFIFLAVVIGWFYISTCNIRESEVRESRRHIMKHLLKNQILHKSKEAGVSVLGSLSRSLSLRKRKHSDKVRLGRSDERVRVRQSNERDIENRFGKVRSPKTKIDQSFETVSMAFKSPSSKSPAGIKSSYSPSKKSPTKSQKSPRKKYSRRDSPDNRPHVNRRSPNRSPDNRHSPNRSPENRNSPIRSPRTAIKTLKSPDS